MGTGGPTALKTLTTVVSCPLFGPYTNFFLTLSPHLFRSPRHRVVKLGILVLKDELGERTVSAGAPPGTRTPDPLIKSQLLYQLS